MFGDTVLGGIVKILDPHGMSSLTGTKKSISNPPKRQKMRIYNEDIEGKKFVECCKSQNINAVKFLLQNDIPLPYIKEGFVISCRNEYINLIHVFLSSYCGLDSNTVMDEITYSIYQKNYNAFRYFTQRYDGLQRCLIQKILETDDPSDKISALNFIFEFVNKPDDVNIMGRQINIKSFKVLWHLLTDKSLIDWNYVLENDKRNKLNFRISCLNRICDLDKVTYKNLIREMNITRQTYETQFKMRCKMVDNLLKNYNFPSDICSVVYEFLPLEKCDYKSDLCVIC